MWFVQLRRAQARVQEQQEEASRATHEASVAINALEQLKEQLRVVFLLNPCRTAPLSTSNFSDLYFWATCCNPGQPGFP